MCGESNKGEWLVVKGFWMRFIELKKFHQFAKQTGIKYLYNILTLLSCDERMGKFAISELCMCIVTASQELIAQRITLKGIASALVSQALPRRLTAIHILSAQ